MSIPAPGILWMLLLGCGHPFEIDRSDYNWIYDPKNPNAVQEGDHTGYVASPNVNALLELSLIFKCQVD